MLKISVIEDEKRIQLILEGKLVPPWTNELRSSCARFGEDLHRELVVDLREVSVIGEDGEDVLLALTKRGAKFRSGGVFTREILKQLAHKANADGRKKGTK